MNKRGLNECNKSISTFSLWRDHIHSFITNKLWHVQCSLSHTHLYSYRYTFICWIIKGVRPESEMSDASSVSRRSMVSILKCLSHKTVVCSRRFTLLSSFLHFSGSTLEKMASFFFFSWPHAKPLVIRQGFLSFCPNRDSASAFSLSYKSKDFRQRGLSGFLNLFSPSCNHSCGIKSCEYICAYSWYPRAH